MTQCPHCGITPLPCPFCGKPGEIFGVNMVACSDVSGCGAVIDFGHWVGTLNDIPDVHFVIEQWNTRTAHPTPNMEG